VNRIVATAATLRSPALAFAGDRFKLRKSIYQPLAAHAHISMSIRKQGILMSISSVSSTPPAAPIQPIETRPPEVKNQDQDDRNPQPQRPPLPPGQGTRIDQYV